MTKIFLRIINSIKQIFATKKSLEKPSSLMPKEFIQKVLINEIGEIHHKYPYIAFAMMAIGIEFLGKMLNNSEDWNKQGQSKVDFESAITSLSSFSSYKPLLSSHDFWTNFRNGYLHTFAPKGTITLSSKDEATHLSSASISKINLKCEDFYIDFKNACEEVLAMNTFNSKKALLPFLNISDDINFSYSGTT